ncbi:MAG: choice-of-anchor J domain-containing protein [Candidatus Cloacimonetes bacterium]|nr:choice-of-anchor J domain-containing protein [Candidatus Cloacimonadota bacterium]
MKQIIGTMLLLLLAGLLFGQWQIDEGFEGITSLPTGWTFHDDGDGMTWRNLNHANAHSGSRAAFVDNYLPNQNADWLVTPQISVNPGDSMVFFTRSWVGTENLKVFASTTGAMPANFTQQLIHVQNIGTTYQEVSLALDQFAGLDIYLAFFWQCTSYGILVDDVKIGQPLNVTPELNLPATVSFSTAIL